MVEGISERCIVFVSGLSSSKIIAGRIVTQPKTPSSTPFAITIPKSLPSVKVIKHSAMNPATVVIELPSTEVTVSFIATAIASLLSEYFCFCSP